MFREIVDFAIIETKTSFYVQLLAPENSTVNYHGLVISVDTVG